MYRGLNSYKYCFEVYLRYKIPSCNIGSYSGSYFKGLFSRYRGHLQFAELDRGAQKEPNSTRRSLLQGLAEWGPGFGNNHIKYVYIYIYIHIRIFPRYKESGL